MKRFILGGVALATAGMLLSQVSAFAATQSTTTPPVAQVTNLTLPASVSAGPEAKDGVDNGPNVQDQVGGQRNDGGIDKPGAEKHGVEKGIDHGLNQGPNVQDQVGSQTKDGGVDAHPAGQGN